MRCPRLPLVSTIALSLTFACFDARAQQTGVIIRKPGSPTWSPSFQVQTVLPPKPSCTTPIGLRSTGEGVPQVPDMIFDRQELVCIRHSDGSSEEFPSQFPHGVLSPKGNEIAYWRENDHTLRLYSISAQSDTVLDSLPSASGLSRISWSDKGRTLVYVAKDKGLPGIRYINLDSGGRGVLEGQNGRIESVPDGEHVLSIQGDSVQLVRLSDGRAEQIADAPFPDNASLSAKGALLGILISSPGNSIDANAPSTTTSSAPETDDDGPDCTGGSFALLVYQTATRHRFDVPFPEKFDTVLDYDFSPDDHAVAVTFGVTGCDYPGDAARVYVVSLLDGTATPVSPKDRLSVQVHWSPDGKTLVYTDYTGSDASLFAVDPVTRKFVRLTDPGLTGPDQFVSWR